MIDFRNIAALGRGGDTELAVVNSREQEMLRQMGGAGTVNPYTGLKEYKGGDAPPDTSPIIDTPVENPSFTPAHPEFASYQNLYRMEHGLAKDAAMPEGWSRTPNADKAILFMKYNNVTPDARNAYYDYVTGLSGQKFTDEKLYNTEMRRSDIMQDLIPKADTAAFGTAGVELLGNPFVPAYGGPTYGGTYTYKMAEGGQVKSDDMNNYQNMAALGRGGDTELAYTGVREREMLRQMGGSDTVNPYTGLKEYKGGGAILSPFLPVVSASSVDQSLSSARPISDLQTVTDIPAPAAADLRAVSLTDQLAPSGQSELSRLMRMYGVSTPAAVTYGGISEPTAPSAFSGTAPTALAGTVYTNQVDAYKSARDAYNQSVSDFNTSIDTYNTDLSKYVVDKAKYDPYIAEYNRRMQAPVSIYDQSQFGYKGELPTSSDILLSPTYAEGGAVKGYAYGDLVSAPDSAGVQPLPTYGAEALRSLPQIVPQYSAPAAPPSTPVPQGALQQATAPELVVAADADATAPPVEPQMDAPRAEPPADNLMGAWTGVQKERQGVQSMLDKYLTGETDDKYAKAEMYFRLASAFASPTTTKQGFMENVGMASGQLAEYAKGQRSAAREKATLAMEGQKYKAGVAKENFDTMIKLKELAAKNPVWKEATERGLAEYRANMAINPLTGQPFSARPVEYYIRNQHDRILEEQGLTAGADAGAGAGTGTGTGTGAGTGPGTSNAEPYVTPGSGVPVISPWGHPGTAKAAQAGAEAESKRLGIERASWTAEKEKEVDNANRILARINFNPENNSDDVSNLIRMSTSGGLQDLVSKSKTFVTGEATAGQKALASLAQLASSMTVELMGGKLGVGISDTDVKMVKEALGDVANPELAAEARLAAWDQAMAKLTRLAGQPYTPIYGRSSDKSTKPPAKPGNGGGISPRAKALMDKYRKP